MLKSGVVLIGFLLLAPGTVMGQRAPSAPSDVLPDVLPGASVWVEVTASTWMPRGRTLADIGPTIRSRLKAAGFTIVPQKSEPHDISVNVRYEERQGRQYRVDRYGTDIRCEIDVDGTVGPVVHLTLVSSSGPANSGTAPYLEALEDFQTNPYYYFVGELIRARITGSASLAEVLIQGTQTLLAEYLEQEQIDQGHGMTFGETVYPSLVLEKSVRELGRLKEVRAAELLTALLTRPDRRLRLASIEALRELPADVSRVTLERAAREDGDREVRAMAAAALVDLTSSRDGGGAGAP